MKRPVALPEPLAGWTQALSFLPFKSHSNLIKQGLLWELLPVNAGDAVPSPAREETLEKGMATHSSILAWENPMDREAWWATVPGVTKSQTQLSDFTLTSSPNTVTPQGTEC